MDGISFHSHDLTCCKTTRVGNSPDNWRKVCTFMNCGVREEVNSSYASHPVKRSVTKCRACI